jgi:hypothetical protein
VSEPPAARGAARAGDGEEAAGLAYVATVSFLASRAAPSAGFFVALAGGTAIARAAQRLGARRGVGASVAAMLESLAIIGPIRFNVPLTQAVTAPILGRLEARGAPLAVQLAICAAIRIGQNSLTTAFFIFVILGGLDAYAGTYDALPARLFQLPRGEEAALVATLVLLLAWGAFATVVQVTIYRRALRDWPAGEADVDPGERRTAAGEEAASTSAPDGDASPPGAGDRPRGPRFDPRFAALAAAVAFGLLLASTDWPLLAGVAVWLALAAALGARGADRTVVATGAALAGLFAFGALFAGLVGGVGLDAALRRSLRAALLVLVATWLRAAAGSVGVREVARRTLGRLRRVPSLPEASAILDGLGSDRRLAGAGSALLARLEGTPKRALPVVDAVLGWVASQARDHVPDAPAPRLTLRARATDAALVAAAALPAAALALA